MSRSPSSPARGLHRKPNEKQVDVYGLTHRGKVRPTNEDHFLICSLNKGMDLHQTSLSDMEGLPLETERLAFLAMVADGVGSGGAGEEASRRTLEAITRYIGESIHTYYTVDPSDDDVFRAALAAAAYGVHAELLDEADNADRELATTLTLWIGLWPRAYLVQVGDSRYYLLKDDTLTQVSQDQTIAQDLVDQGVFSRSEARDLPWADVLSSSLGGSDAAPMVTSIEQDWGYVHLLCSDGLTKHLSDELIEERLRSMTSAKQVCERLLQDALDAGGTDNVTLIVGRAVRQESLRRLPGRSS